MIRPQIPQKLVRSLSEGWLGQAVHVVVNAFMACPALQQLRHTCSCGKQAATSALPAQGMRQSELRSAPLWVLHRDGRIRAQGGRQWRRVWSYKYQCGAGAGQQDQT